MTDQSHRERAEARVSLLLLRRARERLLHGDINLLRQDDRVYVACLAIGAFLEDRPVSSIFKECYDEGILGWGEGDE